MAHDEFQKLSNDRFVEILYFEKDQKKLESLKRKRARVNWEIEEERENFYWQLCRLINDWKSRLPNLREVFCKEEIDWLLTKCVKIGPNELIKFVIRTGYRDEPDLDEDGKPLLLRNTPILYAARHTTRDWISKVRELFKIYDKFNVNYTNESGFTHFHVACMSGCDEIVEKFLELGQDPNCTTQIKKYTPLLYALYYGRKKVSELLMRNGANPHYACYEGFTPLHIICRNRNDDDDIVKMLFELSDDKYQPILINARDYKSSNTPLHLALRYCNKKIVELLLKKGASPNSTNADGMKPLHFAVLNMIDDDLTEKFFEMFGNVQQMVQVDAQDNSGQTLLHLALRKGKNKAAESLLRIGANPNLADKKGCTPLHVISCREIDDDFAEWFFQICDDIGQTVQVDVWDKRGRTPLHLTLSKGKKKAAESLLRRGADPNLASAGGSTTSLHYIVSRRIDDDLVEKFLQITFDIQQTVRVNAQNKLGTTPLHMALVYDLKNMVKSLLKRGADPNIANSDGSTSLHHITFRKINDDMMEWFLEICDNMQLKVQIDALDKSNRTPLLVALAHGSKKIAESLLRRGANANLTNSEGLTYLHVIALHGIDDDLMEWFLEIGDNMQLKVQIDVLDKLGRTPLYLALVYGKKKIAESLLRRGANANLTNLEGLTYLHYMALRKIDDDLEWFFEICDNMQLKVQVDARTNLYVTPLHLALLTSKPKMVEALLRRGADVNLADSGGSTSLLIICKRECDDDLIDIFFKINDDMKQTVQVNARNNLGHTPLHFAVIKLMPHVVDVLLDRGADLSSFVFPSESYFCERFDVIKRKWDKLKLASGILTVLERLEDREYDLSRSDVLTIIKLFVKYGLFEKSSDLSEKYWYDEEEFTSKAKEIIIILSLSLYDLIQLRPKEAAKFLTYKNYFEVERLNNLDKIPEKYRDLCLRHLCEKMSRRYFERLAIDAFQKLIHHRLPILCCDMIIENLKNEDLFRIYEAGEIVAQENKAKLSDIVDKGPVVQKVQFIKRQRSCEMINGHLYF